jgi:hypothetical protein
MSTETPETYESMTTEGGLRERAEDNMGIKEIQEFLELQGYEEIGEGLVGRVYAKPGDDTVVKVGYRHDTWMMIAREQLKSGYQNPHLQVVFSLHIFKDGFVARMERLTENCRGSEMDTLTENCWNYLEDAIKLPTQIPHIVKGVTLAHVEALQFCLDATEAADSRQADLHHGNLMMRGQMPVFIDPIHCRKGAAR